MTVVICLMAMCGFLAMSMNMGILMDSRTQLQAGADSAALAAAGSLDGTLNGLTLARRAAVLYSNEHAAFGQSLIIDANQDVTFGRWHFSPGRCITSSGTNCVGFEPYTAGFAVSNPGRVTAVRVRNGRDGGSHNPEIDLPFGHFVGRLTSPVNSEAVAVGPGTSSTECGLPFGVAVCKIRERSPSTALRCPQSLFFSNEHNDAVGFVSFDGDAPSGHDAAQTINNGPCDGQSRTIGQVRVQNGNDFTHQVIDALQGQTSGDCLIGTVQTMPVISAECESDWDSPQFNQTSDVVGFIRVTIRAVTDNRGEVIGCPGQPAPDVPSPGRRALILDVNCEEEPPRPGDDLGGGEVFNATGARLRLVQ